MNQERELGWDDEIEKDGSEFVLLPEGDYNFTVKKFERARFAGSDKMPACNQAKLELAIHTAEHGDITVFHNLFLHTKTEGLLSNFFAGIGQKKKGEKLRMNWNAVIGSKGKCKLIVNKYSVKGEERANNQVKTFYSYEEVFQNGQTQGQTNGYQGQNQGYQQPQQQYQQQQQMHQTPFPTNNNGFVPGQF